VEGRLIGACGLTCSSCEAFVATQKDDSSEIGRVAAAWSVQFGAQIPPESVWCDGCMTAGKRKCAHTGQCDIRACVQERGLSSCGACADYSCEKLESFLAMLPPEARQNLDSMRA
jgi:hypothetical protein